MKTLILVNSIFANTVDGKKNPPPRVFGHNSLPRCRRGARIGGNGSYKPPGPP